VTTVTANAWLNGEYRPETSLARRIARDHGSTFDELYFGALPPIDADGANYASVSPTETRPDYVRFPLLDGFAGMGRGDYMGDFPEVVDFVEVTREWASEKLRSVPASAVRVITGRGQSMRGVYEDGDLVFVESRVKEFDADAAYVFRWHGRVQIKRLQLIGQDKVRVLSANPDFPPVDVPLAEVEIGGRALAAWTLREF
jgi:phage repressor protein C with HTH and peptisase S24 domain